MLSNTGISILSSDDISMLLKEPAEHALHTAGKRLITFGR